MTGGNFLPVPIPYSYRPDLVDHAQELLALYDEGVKKQIIYGSLNQNGQNYLRHNAQNAQNQNSQNAKYPEYQLL